MYINVAVERHTSIVNLNIKKVVDFNIEFVNIIKSPRGDAVKLFFEN